MRTLEVRGINKAFSGGVLGRLKIDSKFPSLKKKWTILSNVAIAAIFFYLLYPRFMTRTYFPSKMVRARLAEQTMGKSFSKMRKILSLTRIKRAKEKQKTKTKKIRNACVPLKKKKTSGDSHGNFFFFSITE